MSDHSEEEKDFEIFQRLFSDDAGKFIHGGNDFPDFGNTTWGLAIEHTRAFLGPKTSKGSVEKAIESHQKKVCTEIEAKLKSGNYPLGEMRVWFSGDPKNPAKLADEILSSLHAQLHAKAPFRQSRTDDPSVSLPSEIWEVEY